MNVRPRNPVMATKAQQPPYSIKVTKRSPETRHIHISSITRLDAGDHS